MKSEQLDCNGHDVLQGFKVACALTMRKLRKYSVLIVGNTADIDTSNLCQTSLFILKSKVEVCIPVSVLSCSLNKHMTFNYHLLRRRLSQ